MSQFPHLPLFTDAFIADTGHLSAAETGAYLMLLMMAWRLPGCRLPDDDTKLARWARVDPRAWARMKPVVMEFWTLSEGGWAQSRLTKEHDRACARAESARQNGKHGGRPKPLESQDVANPAGSARATQAKASKPIPRDKSSDASASAPLGGDTASFRASDKIWGRVNDLVSLSGRSEVAVRKWVGKALSQYDHDKLEAGIALAVEAGTGDPFGYVVRILTPKSRDGPLHRNANVAVLRKLHENPDAYSFDSDPFDVSPGPVPRLAGPRG